MRKSLWMLPALFLLAATGASAAHADAFVDGTLHFTLSAGGPAPTGSFLFDLSTSLFSSYTVSWNGAVYDFAPAGDIAGFAAATEPGLWCAMGPSAALVCPPALLGSFSLPFFSLQPFSGSFDDASTFAAGTFTVTERVIDTPEPSSVTLMLAGIGLLLVMRKRLTPDPHLAS